MAPDPATETSPLVGRPDGSSGSSPPSKHLALKGNEASPSSPRRGLAHYLSLVTVEPALFLHMLSYGVDSVFKTKMLLDKTCSLQLGYSDDVCKNLDSGKYEKEQDVVQQLTSNYNLYCQLIEMVPGVFIMLLLGAWSDTRSRRLPLLLPLVGGTLKDLGLCCNAYWWSLQPHYVLLSFIPFGLSGGMMAVFMAAYAYLGENSGQRGRTSRMSFATVTMYVAVPVGATLGAAVFGLGGYMAVFGTESVVSFLSVIYVLVRFRNEKPKSVRSEEGEGEEGLVRLLVRRLKRSLKVVTKQRAAGGRTMILGHICCISLFMMTVGIVNFTYLYTRKKFQWTYEDYTVWSISNSGISLVVSCVLLPLLSYRYRVEDSLVGFIGATSHAFFGLLVGTAPVPWILYLAVVLSGGGGITSVASRGALSKLVAPDELGGVFSVVALGESLLPIVVGPLYTVLYDTTVKTFPGAVFLMAAGISLLLCFFYTWLATAFPAPREDDSSTGMERP